MTDRDRLIELCNKKINTMQFSNSDEWFDFQQKVEQISDYLIANGVIVPPCKVGDCVRFKGLTSLWQVDAIHYYREGLPQITVTNGKVTSTITDFETFEVVTKEECD